MPGDRFHDVGVGREPDVVERGAMQPQRGKRGPQLLIVARRRAYGARRNAS